MRSQPGGSSGRTLRAGLRRAGCASGKRWRRVLGGPPRPDRSCSGRPPGLDLVLERRDGLLEGCERRVERALQEIRPTGPIASVRTGGAGRPGDRIRVPVRLRDGKRSKRARTPLDLLEPESFPKLELGPAGAGRSTASRRFRLGQSRLLLGGSGLPSREFGTGLGGGLLGMALRFRAEAPLERASRAVVYGLRLWRGSRHGCVILGTRQRPGKQQPADEHGDQHNPGLRDDAARERALRRPDELLPAAHRSPSPGVNRQRSRLSPIWSHPSPRTWRAMYRPSSVRSKATRAGSPSRSS